MADHLITSNEFMKMRVFGGRKGTKRIGRVKNLIFHPTEKRCIGFLVKRPDLLWMFRRKDLFVSLSGADVVDGRICVRNESNATDGGACKALGVDWKKCIIWLGMPVVTRDETAFGCVDTVVFDEQTGEVDSIETSEGVTSGALLGTYTIPAALIRGFKQGIGQELLVTDKGGNVTDDSVCGAILLSDEAKELDAEGGLAEKGGVATAIAMDTVQTTVEKAKPTVDAAVKATGEAVNRGAFATGRQIARSKTMFSDFKEEYKKAVGSSSTDEPALRAADDGKLQEKRSDAPSRKKTSSQTGNKKPTKQQAPAKGMFAAFKEEYDKARHE